MFWQINLVTSNIDSLLDNEDTTLEILLDEPDVLQECKSQNKRLIEFLIKEEHFEQMISYSLNEPAACDDETKRYKFSNTSCELITSDIEDITNFLIGNDKLLNQLFSYVKTERELNPLLASFYIKIMTLLVTRHTERMIEALQKDSILDNLMNYMGTPAIMDLILKLAVGMEKTDSNNLCVEFLLKEDLVTKLVNLIHPSKPRNQQSNASQCLCDIIQLSRERISDDEDTKDRLSFLPIIQSKEIITLLLDNITCRKSDVTLVGGLNVLLNMVEFPKNCDLEFEKQYTAYDLEQLKLANDSLLAVIVPYLSVLHDVLTDPPIQYFSEMPTTTVTLLPPFGNARLLIVKLIARLLKKGCKPFADELTKLGTFDKIFELMYRYPLNNFLHLLVADIISTMLCAPEEAAKEQQSEESGDSAPQQEDLDLVNFLFQKPETIENFLSAVSAENSKRQGERCGFSGHLFQIATKIIDSSESGQNSSFIKNRLETLPEDVLSIGQIFQTETLPRYKTLLTSTLGGKHPICDIGDSDFGPLQFGNIPIKFVDILNRDLSNAGKTNPFEEEAPSAVSFGEGDKIFQAQAERMLDEVVKQQEEMAFEAEGWTEKPLSFNSDNNAHLPVQDLSRSSSDSDSSSSEEDLESPATISQKTKEDEDDWLDFAHAADDAPVAMETESDPWGECDVEAADEFAFADFKSATNSDTAGWAADFGSEQPFGAKEVMETSGDSDVIVDRSKVYDVTNSTTTQNGAEAENPTSSSS